MSSLAVGDDGDVRAYDTTNSVKATLEFGVEMDTITIAADTYTVTISATQA